MLLIPPGISFCSIPRSKGSKLGMFQKVFSIWFSNINILEARLAREGHREKREPAGGGNSSGKKGAIRDVSATGVKGAEN